MSKATAQSGRLIWIEPNKMDTLSDTGTFDYEDYSICVDLEVRIPKRSACGSENDVVVFHTNHETGKDKVSFFTGTDGFLTTSFTDITAADPNSNKETLGVSSINITYNSYFYPQVTINFVDVRGSSLMYPQEDMFKNGSQGSFFKALFCFPYPQFILKVKGFYGKQVQYDLAVEDFRTAFNPESGNFECTVQFIGYMYGIYADLPMSYLVAAPYADYASNSGLAYWNDQKNKGVFVYDEGTPLDTFMELKNKIKLAEMKIQQVMQNSSSGQTQQNLKTEQEKLDEIDGAISSLLLTINRDLPNVTFKYGKKQIAYCSENSFSLTNFHLNEWGMLNRLIEDYNFNYPERVLPFIDVIRGVKNDDVKKSFDEKYAPPLPEKNVSPYVLAPEFLEEETAPTAFDINNVQMMWTNSATTKTDKDTLTGKLYQGANEFYKNITDEDIKGELSYYENKENIYAHIFSTNDIFQKIQSRKDAISKELETITESIDNNVKSLYKEVLGFVPTLSNIFKVIFAHMDTFMQLYYNVLNVINQQKLGTERTPSYFKLNSTNSDLVSNENFVPPYPLVTNNDSAQKNVAMWPGDYIPASNMEELKFTESLFKCINVITQKINNFNKSILGSEQTQMLSIPKGEERYSIENMASNIVPTTLSDLYFFQNPYQIFGISKEKLTKQALFSTLGYRFVDAMLGASNDIHYDTKGVVEAINFAKYVPTLNLDRPYEVEIINMLKNESNYDNAASEFITYIKSTKDDFNNRGETPYHNIEMSPILGGQYYPVNYGDISAVKPGDTNFFPDKKFYIQQINLKNIGFYWDVMRKTEKDIPDEKYAGWFENYFGRNYKANDEWWIYDYSEEKGVNDWIGGAAKSLIYGSFHGYFWAENTERYKIFTMGLYTASDNIDDKKPAVLMYNYDNKYRYILVPKDYGYESINGGTSTKYLGLYGGLTWESLDSITKYITHDMPCYVLDPSKLYGASLYGSEFFYMQNDTPNTDMITYKDKEYSKKDLAKAYLFLEACAPFGITNMDNINRVFLFTKWTMLLWGARLLRKGLPDDTDLFNIKTSDGSEYSLPKKGNPMYVKFARTPQFQRNSGGNTDYAIDIQIPGFSKGEKSYFDFTCDFSFCEGQESEFIEMFIQWATNDFKTLINDNLELRLKNGASIGSRKFKEILEKVKNKNLDESIFSDKTRETYCMGKTGYINSYKPNVAYSQSSGTNDDTDYGFYLFINPKSNISRQLLKYRFDTYLYCPITPNVITKSEKYSESRIKDGFKSFLKELNKFYTNNNRYVSNETMEVDTNEVSQQNLTERMLRNKDLKLSLYLTLKNLYDRWLCGMSRNRWKYDFYINPFMDTDKLCEFNNFYFIDSFYNDISKQIVVDLNTLKELIDSLMTNRIGDGTYTARGMKYQGTSIYQFMASILQKNSMNFLAVPCFNRYKTQEDIKELFTPYSWFDRGEPRGTSYIGIYPHQVSKHLNIEGANGYQYPNDGVDIADINGEFKDTVDIPDFAVIDGGYTIPAFGVTYGRQDQSYFKKVTVNMDSPQVTEYSIGATLDIANSYGENQKVQTFVGQDLYRVYSNHSYTCTVEMMGNAMITPLMYFQLNNIPMFRGAYMVIKVEHSISQGNMITTFTGVRISKNKIPFVKATIEGELNEDDIINGGNNGGNNGNGGDTILSGTPEGAQEQINAFIEAARFALNRGIKEEPLGSNYVPEIPELPVQGIKKDYAWCAIFVGWCAERAGISPDIIGGPGGWYKGVNWTNKYASTCDAHYSYYSKLEATSDFTCIIQKIPENRINNPLQTGDLVLFSSGDYESNKKFKHIGIVENYNPETGKVTYIDGNSGHMVKRHTIDFDAKGVGCYIRPPFGYKIEKGPNGANVIAKSTTPPVSDKKPNNQTAPLSNDDVFFRTKEEKLRIINAVIWQESTNNHAAHGDKKIKDQAYGILQVRQPKLDYVNNILRRSNKLKLLGSPVGNNPQNLTREEQVQLFLSQMEYAGYSLFVKNSYNTYIKTGKDKSAESIPWSMKMVAGYWNGGEMNGYKAEYYNSVLAHYNQLKENPSSMPPPVDKPGWTPDAAFNAFFS